MGIGDGYLQEMRMVCMDEYDMARDEGSASEEELEKMRSNLEAIEKRLMLPFPVRKLQDASCMNLPQRVIRIGTTSYSANG